MKILLSLLAISFIFILGYASYADAQNKKREELIKIVNDAELSLNEISHNPNYVKHSSHFSHYKQKN